ncbi:hypothetical protein [Pseudoalteromonas sp. S1688]|uniref:hypothetical protein n=1 Tax=Pseudoalteromonas sp. S1688 TaxID=579511 RepID=UPI00110BE9EF|nr:hypothetical protein [Pseudoalteromonas sp. S1688]TMP50254.1 hypothetical protein CWB81_11225 [Pseudoalteromonas sp. S1688]
MKKLSEQDISLILELVKTLPITEVADKFDVYPETIRYHMRRNSVELKGSVPALKVENANVPEQLKTKSIAVIAKEIGVSTGTIYYQLEKKNITKTVINNIQRDNKHLLLSAIREKVNSGMKTSLALKAHGITQKKYERLTTNQLKARA